MKKNVYLVGFLFLSTLLWAQDEKVRKVETEITSAIIYLDGAEIHRSKKVSLEKGRTKVIFTGLSPKFNPDNIQVTTTNRVELLAIAHRIDYLKDVKEKPRIQKLKDSLDLINLRNGTLNNDKDAYNIEKDMLVSNSIIGGRENGVSVSELKLAADLFRSRIMEINRAITKIDVELNKNYKTINRINNQLVQANAKTSYSRGEITLLLNADATKTTEIDLKYLVGNAGWTPSYDIRAEDVNKPIKLEYKAFVYNNTDIDWKNIDFKLSTADPTLSATQPKLSPWYLNYHTSINYNPGYGKKSLNLYQRQAEQSLYRQQVNEAIDGIQEIKAYEEGSSAEGYTGNQYSNGGANYPSSSSSNFENIAVSELSAEFEIDKPYSIPSDDKPYIVDVTEHELPTLYKHFVIPKIEKDAFLLARITNWQDLNLVEGTANIYFGGTFVGRSFISTRNVSDTLDISLGRDNKVLVTRTKLKDFSEVKYIGSNRKETHAYRIVVKNNRKGPIDIEVYDQFPVSQDGDIEVSVEETSDAKKNDLTGELKWVYKVESSQSKKMDLTFTVKYPKNKPVAVRKSKSRSQRVRTKF